MDLPNINQLELDGKRVLLRVDFNVPFFKIDRIPTEADISDDFRIRAVVPTIKLIIEKGGIPIILAHLGRPKGKRDVALSLLPIGGRLSHLLGKDVIFTEDCVGERVERLCSDLKKGDVVLLENLRFHQGEESNNAGFAKELAVLGEVYINEAFGDAHRAHASIVGIPKLLPHAAGPLMTREIEAVGRLKDNPERPLVAVMGGSKISTKIDFLERFLPWVDHLLLGGALASTLIKAQGHNIGKSFTEESMLERVSKFDFKSPKVHIPVDFIVAKEASSDAKTEVRSLDGIQDDESIFDIGPETRKIFAEIIGQSKTVFWNGPMGMHEISIFARGTEMTAEAVALSEGFNVVGGGDTTVIIERLYLDHYIDFISTGGGAMLEFLCGESLPGIEALRS